MQFTNISADLSKLSQQYQELALTLQIPENNTSVVTDHLLTQQNNILQIQKQNFTKGHKQGPIFIDFTANNLTHRQERLHQEPLLKAIKIKGSPNLTIIDATAGLGTDAFLLAANNYQVIALEQNPIVHALLENAITRAKQSNTCSIINNIHLILENSVTYLTNLSSINLPDIIYLDPMFPVKQKSANVNKEMEFLQAINTDHNTAENNLTLFNLALLKAKHKVVIKRPIHANFISQKTPSYSLKYRSTRFDIYLTYNI